jgi:6,7-dimethyl-8-ribityllumazine synthase
MTVNARWVTDLQKNRREDIRRRLKQIGERKGMKKCPKAFNIPMQSAERLAKNM